MNIIQVTSHYYPYIGGVEKVVQSISEEMVMNGHYVEVLTSDAKENSIKTEVINNVIINHFPSSFMFDYSNELYKYLLVNKTRIDIIHAHSFHTLLPYLACRAKSNIDCKLVLTGHYHGRGRILFTNLLLKFGFPLFRNAYKRADIICCLTEFEKRSVIQDFNIDAGKTRIVPNAVASKDISIAEPFQKEGTILLIVSRLEKYKNIQYAIKALKYLEDKYILVIIGHGTYRDQLEKLVSESKLKSRVLLLGSLTDKDVFRWYKTCDLVLNFSSLESFGISVIEGLAASKKVLVNNKTALKELAEKFEDVSVIDIEKSSPNEIALKIKEIVNMEKISNEINEYNWRDITSKLLDLYENG